MADTQDQDSSFSEPAPPSISADLTTEIRTATQLDVRETELSIEKRGQGELRDLLITADTWTID